MKEWLLSITDDELKHYLEDRCFIGGGAIVSLLKNEEPNDYDVYFTNVEAVEKVLNYYNQTFLYMGGNNLSDIKIVDNKVSFKINVQDVDKKHYNTGCSPLFYTKSAITLKNKIQLIVKYFGNEKDVIKKFDFQHTHCYYSLYTDKLFISDEAMDCITNKKLVYTAKGFQLSSFFRMKKFLKRGWDISFPEMLKIAYKISMLDLNDIDILDEQLVGVSTGFCTDFLDKIKQEEGKITEDSFLDLLEEMYYGKKRH